MRTRLLWSIDKWVRYASVFAAPIAQAGNRLTQFYLITCYPESRARRAANSGFFVLYQR